MTRMYLQMRLAEMVPSMSLKVQERMTPPDLEAALTFVRIREKERAREVALLAGVKLV